MRLGTDLHLDREGNTKVSGGGEGEGLHSQSRAVTEYLEADDSCLL